MSGRSFVQEDFSTLRGLSCSRKGRGASAFFLKEVSVEKALLVLALLGTVHLVSLGVRLVFSFREREPEIRLDTVIPDATSMAIRNDGEDWSKYEGPTFIRRGIPMPKLEPVPKKPMNRKRRSKANAPVKPVASDAAAFEIVA